MLRPNGSREHIDYSFPYARARPESEQNSSRVPQNADYKREKLAIQELTQQMVDHPEGLMPAQSVLRLKRATRSQRG
jgi:hypothetical protein